MSLRTYQTKAIEDTREASARFKRVMLQLPTGAGKTKIAAELIRSAVEKAHRVAFVVPYRSLINQTYLAFLDAGIDRDPLGVIQADHPLDSPSANVQICSVQTLESRNFLLPDFDVVIVDEAHIVRGYWDKWLEENDHHLIGLSATPWSPGLGKLYQHLIIGATTQQLIDEGFLSPFRVYAPSKPDLEGLKTSGDDYNQKQLATRVRKKKLIADIVDTWKTLSTGEKTLCFAVNRAHAKEIQTEFLLHGIPSGYIDAFTDAEEREEIRKQFHDGTLKVVCNVGCLVAGVDWDVRSLILATPTKSEIKYVQMVGRALRTADGKQHALILDHSDTTSRLGFVTDIHHSHLDMGLKQKKTNKKKEVLPKPCPKCGALKTTKICESCGFESIPQSHVENQYGQLVRQDGPTESEKEDLWAQLLTFQRRENYQEGWVFHTCKKLLGGVPKKKNIQPRPLTEEVEKQIKVVLQKARAAYHIRRKAKSMSTSGGFGNRNTKQGQKRSVAIAN